VFKSGVGGHIAATLHVCPGSIQPRSAASMFVFGSSSRFSMAATGFGVASLEMVCSDQCFCVVLAGAFCMPVWFARFIYDRARHDCKAAVDGANYDRWIFRGNHFLYVTPYLARIGLEKLIDTV
jgi:hypothetical protein